MQNITKIGYSRKEAALASSLSVRTIDYLLSQRMLEAIKVNRRVIISARSLQKLIEPGMKGDGAERSINYSNRRVNK